MSQWPRRTCRGSWSWATNRGEASWVTRTWVTNRTDEDMSERWRLRPVALSFINSFKCCLFKTPNFKATENFLRAKAFLWMRPIQICESQGVTWLWGGARHCFYDHDTFLVHSDAQRMNRLYLKMPKVKSWRWDRVRSFTLKTVRDYVEEEETERF